MQQNDWLRKTKKNSKEITATTGDLLREWQSSEICEQIRVYILCDKKSSIFQFLQRCGVINGLSMQYLSLVIIGHILSISSITD